MDQVLGLRPFVPAKDFAASQRFYRALGFDLVHADDQVAIFETEGFSFILQNFYVAASAENFMIQLLVRDIAAWWQRVDGAALTTTFGVKAPIPPHLQHWGLVVGFIFDPSGVLWHVAEAPRP